MALHPDFPQNLLTLPVSLRSLRLILFIRFF